MAWRSTPRTRCGVVEAAPSAPPPFHVTIDEMRIPSRFGYRFAAVVACAWGLAILVHGFGTLGTAANPAYMAGQLLSMGLGGLLVFGGVRWWKRGNRIAAGVVPDVPAIAADPAPDAPVPHATTTRALRRIVGRIALVCLALAVVGICSMVGWVKYSDYKQHQRDEQVRSFLVDEFVKVDGPAKPGSAETLAYAKQPPCPMEYIDDATKKKGTFDPCEYLNPKNREFVDEHQFEMNDFIWEHQSDPRVPRIQQVLWSWDFYAKLTCQQMRAGFSRYSQTNPGFKEQYSNYDLYKAGCI